MKVLGILGSPRVGGNSDILLEQALAGGKTAQMKAYLDRWCAFFDAEWQWHKAYRPKMKGKRIGLITLCGDPNVSTADPIVHSFKNTCQFAGLNLMGVV